MSQLMANPCSLEFVSGTDHITVVVTGDVDLTATPLVDEAMTHLGMDPRNLRIDLRGVTFMDSTGINMLVRVNNACVDNGGSLTVVAPTDAIRELFEITRLDKVLTIE
jgi:anti-sigma B factor antagonist